MRAPEALALCLAVALPAQAALGDASSGIQADAIRLATAHRQAAAPGYDVHTLRGADGSVVREYVGRDGVVFAVTWATQRKPRLDQLLGRHFDGYVAASREAQQRRAGVHHQARLERGDLVVESTAHLDAYRGRAYLRSLWPAGLPSDALR